MADILSGAPVVAALGELMKADVEVLKGSGVVPSLCILRVGERPDDISYEKNAGKRCESVGINVKNIVLPEDVSQDVLLERINMLNNDKTVHGVLLFRPLPSHLNERVVCETLCSEKDIDCITLKSLADVFTGNNETFNPCTAQAVLEILDFYGIDCSGKNVVVIGRSLVVGKPLSIMLLSRNATVTICHTRTKDLSAISSNADIVIAATGQPEGLTKEYFNPGQVVIDVGINWNDSTGKLCGDVKFNEVEPIVAAISPVPGGVGTVTTSVLASNVIKAAKKQHNHLGLVCQ